MGISELRQLGARPLAEGSLEGTIGEELVRSGRLSRSDALRAQLVRRHCDTSLERILSAEGLVGEDDLLTAQARRLRLRRLSADEVAAAPVCDHPLDPRLMLKHGFVPLRDEQDRTVLALSDAAQLREMTADLPEQLEAAPRVLAPRQAVLDRITAQYRPHLAQLAQMRVDALESCRNWGVRINRRMALVLAAVTALCAVTMAFPTMVFSLFVLWAAFTLLVTAALKTAAFVARLSAPDGPARGMVPDEDRPPLPRVSVLVPLFREREILHALIARLTQLTYPKCLLDVVLVLEEEDDLTQAALARIDLPPWIRVVVVPDGTPRTKPRAMNYALDFCEGDMGGIFDANDVVDRRMKNEQRLPQSPNRLLHPGFFEIVEELFFDLEGSASQLDLRLTLILDLLFRSSQQMFDVRRLARCSDGGDSDGAANLSGGL